MNSAEDLFIALSSVGFTGIANAADVVKFAEDGVSSADYRYLVLTLCKQLKQYLNLEESVETSDEALTFMLELSGFLRELECPFQQLMASENEQRFSVCNNCLLLLDYLVSELQTARLILKTNPDFLKAAFVPAPSISKITGSMHAMHFQNMCKSLGFPKPPANISANELCAKVSSRVKDAISSWPSDYLGKPIVYCQISSNQWKSLCALNDIFTEEYAIRREMLLTRLDVTVRSFGWGDRGKGAEIENIYLPLRQIMKVRTGLSAAAILAARDDLTRIRKTCDPSIRERTKCDINKTRMGAVPDRGGRANEYDAPAPEMPQWQKRQADSSANRGRGGYHRGGASGGVFDRLDGRSGGGDRPQSGYYQDGGHNQSQNFRPQSNFDQFGDHGNYQDRGHSGGGRGRGNYRGQRY